MSALKVYSAETTRSFFANSSYIHIIFVLSKPAPKQKRKIRILSMIYTLVLEATQQRREDGAGFGG